MKKWWNSFKIAFSMFSKIPMPMSEWTDENMEYAFIFFPFVGTVIGAVLYGVALLLHKAGLQSDNLFRIAVLTLVPLLLTGGIHLDGFLDVSDAMSSWQEKERRLEILKDSHAGAFAIIRGLMFFILYLGTVSLINVQGYLLMIPALTMNRACIAFTVVTWKKAKSTGLVSTFSRAARTRQIQLWSAFLVIAMAAVLLFMSFIGGIAIVAACAGVMTYYHHMSFRYFGGINGDLAGWCNEMSELMILLAIALTMLATGGNIWN